jgi:cytochrome c oxidase subunit 4
MSKTASIAIVWALLALLLASTMVLSTILTGPVGLLAGLAIATAKAGLVSWRFMHLDEQPGLARIAAIGATAWLVILFSLTGLDYMTR